MASSGTLRRMTLVRTDVSEERRFLQEPHGVTSQKPAFSIKSSLQRLHFHLQKAPSLVFRKRNIPTERPPCASEVCANFCG
jgi:hypothetical protein